MNYIQSEEIVFVNKHPYMYVGDGQYLPAVMGGAEPEVDDLAKVQSFIKGEVETYFNELKTQLPAAQPEKTPAQVEDEGKRQIRELISPFIEPGLQEARFAGQSAEDYVKFYTGNTEAIEYQEQVEDMFTKLKAAGRPLPRADILSYIQGTEYRADKDKFIEKASAKRKQQLETAQGAVDFGSMGMTKGKVEPLAAVMGTIEQKSGDELSAALKDMEAAMQGMTF